MRHITLITTGGTIEKTYDDTSGTLENRRSIVGRMLSRLRLEDTRVCCQELMSKDSLFMTDEDRAAVVAAVRRAAADTPAPAGIVILHGTDTLATTGELLHRELSPCPVPVVLTGAMRPYEMKQSDALQNLTEAVFAAGVLAPGVYCVAHGRALRFPGVTKDKVRRTFTGG
jgi:L-asparaginase